MLGGGIQVASNNIGRGSSFGLVGQQPEGGHQVASISRQQGGYKHEVNKGSGRGGPKIPRTCRLCAAHGVLSKGHTKCQYKQRMSKCRVRACPKELICKATLTGTHVVGYYFFLW